LDISTVEVVNGNFGHLREIVSLLGLTYREEELKEFISPSYWHGNTDKI
jgi:hypothetical protein